MGDAEGSIIATDISAHMAHSSRKLSAPESAGVTHSERSGNPVRQRQGGDEVKQPVAGSALRRQTGLRGANLKAWLAKSQDSSTAAATIA